jgi:uncharacterized protein
LTQRSQGSGRIKNRAASLEDRSDPGTRALAAPGPRAAQDDQGERLMHEMPVPIVSAVTAGALILLQMALTLFVVLARRKNRQSLGDGGNPDVLRAIRRHGNLAENAAMFIAGFSLFELLGGPKLTLEILCAVFVLARLSHAIGLSLTKTINPLRVLGILATVAVGVALGVQLLIMGISRLPPIS